MSVPFSVQYLQANYFYVSICGVMLAQLFQIFLTLLKNSDLGKNEGKNLWKNLVRIDYKHFSCKYLPVYSVMIPAGMMEFCLERLQVIRVRLYFCYIQVEKMFPVPASWKNEFFTFKTRELNSDFFSS